MFPLPMEDIIMKGAQPSAVEYLLNEEARFAGSGIVKKELHATDSLKVVLFSCEKGQALGEHAAPFEATIHVLAGRGEIRLGGTSYRGEPGALYVMPAGLVHSITATERLVFLVTMARGRPGMPDSGGSVPGGPDA